MDEHERDDAADRAAPLTRRQLRLAAEAAQREQEEREQREREQHGERTAAGEAVREPATEPVPAAGPEPDASEIHDVQTRADTAPHGPPVPEGSPHADADPQPQPGAASVAEPGTEQAAEPDVEPEVESGVEREPDVESATEPTTVEPTRAPEPTAGSRPSSGPPDDPTGGSPDTPADEAGDPLLASTMPREVPEEPDVDDVRWDGPPPPPVPAFVPTSGWAPRTGDDQPRTWPALGAPPTRPSPPEAPMHTDDSRRGGATATPTTHRPSHASHPAVDDALAPPADDTASPGVPTGGWGPVAHDAGSPDSQGGAVRADETLPTLNDLLASRSRPSEGPAEQGWRAALRRMTGGLVALPPGPAEQRLRSAVASVQRDLDGPKTVVVINPKGGAHKTTATLLIAATFGTHRGGYTLAWDNNETRGTLGWRSQHGRHQHTAVDLLQDLDRFTQPRSARVGDLDAYVRSQTAQFDVLASDEDAASAASIDATAFRALHSTLSRFYRVLVVDTGNNMRASNWQAAVDTADQVVIVSTVREDTAQSAAWAVDALRAAGREDVVRNAVTVLAAPAVRRDTELDRRLHDHFGRLTRAVLDVPYDPALVAGGPLDVDALQPQTREAWLHVTAAVADGL